MKIQSKRSKQPPPNIDNPQQQLRSQSHPSPDYQAPARLTGSSTTYKRHNTHKIAATTPTPSSFQRLARPHRPTCKARWSLPRAPPSSLAHRPSSLTMMLMTNNKKKHAPQYERRLLASSLTVTNSSSKKSSSNHKRPATRTTCAISPRCSLRH